MAAPGLSLCIVNYRARDYLKDCLESIYQSPPQVPFEVIVVDNASKDGTLEMLSELFPQVRVIENEVNLGYTHPMNQALAAASGKYRIQLNPDTLIPPGTFDCLYQYMEANPWVGICTPKVLNRDGTLQLQCRRSAARPWDTFTYVVGLSKLFPHSKTFSGYLMTYMDENQIFEVEAVSGSCMVIREDVIQQIGLLDELFFAYQEDTDFCLRAGRAGWKIMYVPEAHIIHYGGQGGTGVEVYRSVFEWHRSYFRYYRKNLARDYFFLVNGLFYGGMLLKLGIWLTATFFRKRKYAGSRKP